MNRDRFARKLIEGPNAERIKLLARHRASCDATLAKSLQNLCYEVWTNEPQKVSEIAATLDLIAEVSDDSDEIKAFAEWTRAIEHLVKGELKKCILHLDKSEKSFVSLGKTHHAATTQISKLYALALLGHYDEAVACGLRAREIFLKHNDVYSVGKIEHNIGNLYWRRNFYRESEPYPASAHERFSQINDVRQLAMVENCQAFVKALQNDFRAAEVIYETALTRAKSDSLIVTEAEIEIGLSNLFLFQGKFDRALKFLESSRRKYEILAMPQPTANCELEIADIYLEINFLNEAAELYESVAEKYGTLGMQAELGRCLLNYSRALFVLNEIEKANETLERAENLFNAEGNKIANAAVYLLKAQISLRKNDFTEAKSHAETALRISLNGANPRYELSARWLLGEISSSENNLDESRRILSETLETARKNLSPIEYFCLVSLGVIAFRQNDYAAAEMLFQQAIDLTENSRTTLAAEEFRAAFAAGKLLPYQKLVEIKLREKDFHAAFEWLERSRSRTLYEAMNGEDFAPDLSPDSAEAALYAEQKSLREELNWFYSRLNRGKSSGLEARQKKSELHRAVTSREKKLAEISRRITTNGDFNPGKYQTASVGDLQKNLPAAHLISKGANVKVAVLDTEIDMSHPLFAGRLLPGRDFVDNDNDPSEVGTPNAGAFGHGTHVAGIVLMVAPDAKIIPIRVLDQNGVGNIWTLSQALNYAANPDGNPATDDGTNIINLSLGTIQRTNLVTNLLDAVGTPHPHRSGDFPNIEDPNIVVTAAAGNTGDTTKIYPAAETVRGLLAVGASTNADTLASFSTRGLWVQIVAPGERIVSAIPGGRYGVWRGTSMSAPIVAGVAALIKAKYPTLESDQIIFRIRGGSVPLPNTMMRRIDAAIPYAVLTMV